MNLFSNEMRRNPYPVYDRFRAEFPLLRIPPPFDAWMVFDYENVKRVLNDHETFSSAVPAPKWFIFADPPHHTRMRGLVSHAFTPRIIAGLERRVHELSRELLDGVINRGAMDLVTEYAAPLAGRVIAGMMGIPAADLSLYQRWSEIILQISYARSSGAEAERSMHDFVAVTEEMSRYLAAMVLSRRRKPQDDLLSGLVAAQADGEQLRDEEILSFFQLLIVAGQETTTNLIGNAFLCLLENPDQLSRLRSLPELPQSALAEVLRYRSPLQWAMRSPRRDIELHGILVPRGALVLPVIGSANRDPRQFAHADRFDIGREPNPHLAFGHGIHFCLGAALSRLEARIALTDLLERLRDFELATDAPWEPQPALNVHGPAQLPIRFESNRHAAVSA